MSDEQLVVFEIRYLVPTTDAYLGHPEVESGIVCREKILARSWVEAADVAGRRHAGRVLSVSRPG